MTKTEPERQTYTASQVCKAAGIELSTLRTWRNKRKLIVVEKGSEQEWTRYTEIDALRICGLATLGRFGIDLEIAAYMFRDYALQLDDRLYDGDPLFLSMSFRVDESGKTRIATDLSRSIYPDDLFAPDLSNSVAVIVDVAKIFRSAMKALRGTR